MSKKAVVYFIPVAAPSTPSNAYVAEDGTTYYVAEDGATYYVPEALTHTLIGSATFTTTETGWSGYTIRQKISPLDLLYKNPTPLATIQVTLQFDAATTGSILSCYIGNLTGTNQNYDGNQVQILFGGSGSVVISGSTPVVSDQIYGFNYNPGAVGIALSFAVGSGAVSTRNTGAVYAATTQVFYLAGDHSADTSFTGSGEPANILEAVSKIDLTV